MAEEEEATTRAAAPVTLQAGVSITRDVAARPQPLRELDELDTLALNPLSILNSRFPLVYVDGPDDDVAPPVSPRIGAVDVGLADADEAIDIIDSIMAERKDQVSKADADKRARIAAANAARAHKRRLFESRRNLRAFVRAVRFITRMRIAASVRRAGGGAPIPAPYKLPPRWAANEYELAAKRTRRGLTAARFEREREERLRKTASAATANRDDAAQRPLAYSLSAPFLAREPSAAPVFGDSAVVDIVPSAPAISPAAMRTVRDAKGRAGAASPRALMGLFSVVGVKTTKK